VTGKGTFIALIAALALVGCAHHAIDIEVTPPIVPPAVPQQTLAVVPLNNRPGPFVTGAFHDDLKGAIRQTQGFQIIDYGGPWPAACSQPMPGQSIDLRQLVAEIQRVCPSDHTLLYEVTQVSPVRPIRIGVRTVMIRSADGAVVLDYDGVWEGPVAPPTPIPRGGVLGWILPPIVPAHDPLSEVSPRILGQRASRDIALMLTGVGGPQPPPPASAGPTGPDGMPQDPAFGPLPLSAPDSMESPILSDAPTMPPLAPPYTPPQPPLPELGVIE
jgi:hypothetical protein